VKHLVIGALMATLCGIPGVTRGETPRSAQSSPAIPYYLARPATDAPSGSTDAASDYAARENASPQLAEFSGGGDGVYIGTGALVVAAVILILVLAL
jgi:hypothetical protein